MVKEEPRPIGESRRLDQELGRDVEDEPLVRGI